MKPGALFIPDYSLRVGIILDLFNKKFTDSLGFRKKSGRNILT